MQNCYGEEIDYRPVYRNGRFYVVPFGDNDYCVVDTQGVFASGRVISSDQAFVVSDTIGSIYLKAVFDCCERVTKQFGEAGRKMADELKAELCKGFGFPQELSEEDTERVLNEMK